MTIKYCNHFSSIHSLILFFTLFLAFLRCNYKRKININCFIQSRYNCSLRQIWFKASECRSLSERSNTSRTEYILGKSRDIEIYAGESMERREDKGNVAVEWSRRGKLRDNGVGGAQDLNTLGRWMIIIFAQTLPASSLARSRRSRWSRVKSVGYVLLVFHERRMFSQSLAYRQ